MVMLLFLCLDCKCVIKKFKQHMGALAVLASSSRYHLRSLNATDTNTLALEPEPSFICYQR